MHVRSTGFSKKGELVTLDEAKRSIGSGVVYVRTGEEGVITSTNNSFVFVRYSTFGDGIATHPHDLTLISNNGILDVERETNG